MCARPAEYDKHPSAFTFQDVVDKDLEAIDMGVLKSTVLRHTKHQKGYCLRVPKTTKNKPRGETALPECRFDFPKELQNRTIVEVEEQEDGDFRVYVRTKRNDPLMGSVNPTQLVEVEEQEDGDFRVYVRTKRNDPLMGSVNPTQLKHWRANCDFQIVSDPQAVTEYMLKYKTKSETMSDTVKQMFQGLVKGVVPASGSNLVRKLMMKIAGQRDISTAEAGHCLFSTPLTSSSETFVVLNMNGDRQLNLESGTVAKNMLDMYAEQVKMI